MLISNDFQMPKSKMLEAVLDALAFGVALTARDGRVLHMNAAAAHQIKKGHLLTLVNSRLRPNDPRAARSLASASLRSATVNSMPRNMGRRWHCPTAKGRGSS